jgi:pyruvate dehydrogenase E2 component (dihydrolipoamide acetyltransferase)
MSHHITLPELGEGITSGNIVNLLASEGDTIAAGQPLLEVETDKAVVEVPATAAGRIKKFLVKPGDTAKVGSPLLELEPATPTNSPNGTAATTPPPKQTPAPPPPQPTHHTPPAAATTAPTPQQQTTSPTAAHTTDPITITLPGLGEGITGGAVVSLRLAPGDTITAGQALIEVETDKAVVEVPAPHAGKLIQYLIAAGDHIKIGQPIATITPATPNPPPHTPNLASDKPNPAPDTPNLASNHPQLAPATHQPLHTAHATVAGRSAGGAYGAAMPRAERVIPAGPATRRFARELGVGLTLVTGTGPGGRITIDDVKNYVKTNGMGRGTTAAPGFAPAAPPLPDFTLWGDIERQPLANLRKRIVEQMQLAWTIPMVTQFDQADITDLEAFRKRNAPAFKERGASLTITAFAIKAAVAALKKFPQFNSTLDLARGELILKKYIHIGIAVDTPAGLIVPVIRDADKKTLAQLSFELAELAKKARERKITPNELQGATFTISNLGGIGGTQFTPLVNPPQVAILGISRGEIQPRWNGAVFEPRLLMPLSVSYDHRVVDGADGARFTRTIAEALENYAADLLT